MKVARQFQDFINFGEGLKIFENELEVLGVVGFEVKVTATAQKRGNGGEPFPIGSSILFLGLFWPRIRKEHVQEIDFPRTKHSGEAIRVRSECKEVLHLEFARFFGETVDLFELPIDPNIERTRILSRPFEADVSSIAADFYVK